MADFEEIADPKTPRMSKKWLDLKYLSNDFSMQQTIRAYSNGNKEVELRNSLGDSFHVSKYDQNTLIFGRPEKSHNGKFFRNRDFRFNIRFRPF